MALELTSFLGDLQFKFVCFFRLYSNTFPIKTIIEYPSYSERKQVKAVLLVIIPNKTWPAGCSSKCFPIFPVLVFPESFTLNTIFAI